MVILNASRTKVKLTLFCVSLILSACAQQELADDRLSSELALDEAVELHQARDKTNVPAAISDALLASPMGQTGLSQGKSTQERFDLAVRDVSAKSFFLGLVEGTGVNVVVHPEVSGTISLELNDVSVQDVLEVAKDIYGYEYKYNRGIYTIYPSKLRTEIFHINYLDVQRVGVSDTSVLVGKIESSDNNNNSSNSNSSGESANLLGYLAEKGEGGSSGEGVIPGSRVQTLNRTDFWRGLYETATAIIGGEQADRMVMVTPQAGMMVVKALPQELNAVRDFLERAELSVKRQVILEAKIIEVRLNSDFEAGINWSAIGGEILLAKNVSEFQAPNEILTASESVGEVFASLVRIGDISQLLRLLETQGNVQVLSSPRISTVNNQKAVIRVGTDEFFVTGISSDTVSNASSTTSTPNIELSSFFSGIALDVTPQIAADGDVILHIHPVISDVQDQLKELTVGDEQFSLPLALRDIRESDSIVRAKNGQVIVLGGLMQDAVKEEDGKRPFLGDVPLVNKLFKTKSKQSVKTELVILLRPVVVDENTWKNSLTDHQKSMRRMGDKYRQTFGDG